MRIYTKGGDKGTTGIFGGSRVEKDDIRIEANGTLDELNASLGMLRALLDEQDERQEMLAYLQRSLMVVMSQVATPSAIREENPNKLPEDLDLFCERHIDRMNKEMQHPSTYFILPEGTPVSAQCHVARTIARRAERRLCTLNRTDEVPPLILRFVNRLSDLLFTLARWEMDKKGSEEERWKAFLYKKNMHLRSIMFVGTCSDAGKSIINTAFCRIFKQDGHHPAPFKAQNMSLNSYSTPDGLEIGRAQAVQAEACGIAPESDMNPVLLKPTNDQSSQVVLNGKPIGNMSAKEYFMSNNKAGLFDQAYAAYERLHARYNPIVLEGAGSISELNLRDRDITNMRMAVRTDAATYLVADIDRGGVFASVYGSIALLSAEERRQVKGIIINKFRGDISLFDEGRRLIQELTGIPVVGVIPYFRDIHIEQEDSVALETKHVKAESGKINVAIVLLKRMSNFTDFNVLERDDRFHAYYTNNTEEIRKADIIILPGTKNTIADLQNIRENGIAEAITRAHRDGKKVIGICGGYQMLGARIEDPNGIEGDMPAIPGLGILPLVTVMEAEKVTRQRQFKFRNHPETCQGYEIHMGHTTLLDGENPSPLNRMLEGQEDGYLLDDKCWGTYLHGILDNDIVLNDLAEGLTRATPKKFDYAEFKNQQYDKLAQHVRSCVDMEYIYSTLKTK